MNFRGVSQMGKFAGIADPEELWERWLTCKWVRSFESGRCSELAFAAGVVEDWQLRMSPADYLEEFRSWPKGVLPGAEALVIEVKSRVPVSCFSNTNVLHWQYAQTWPLMGLFGASCSSTTTSYTSTPRSNSGSLPAGWRVSRRFDKHSPNTT